MKPYFKSNYRIKKPTSEWVCIENAHETIIPSKQFEAVSRLLLMDTRKAPGKKLVPALVGFIQCQNCGQNMILKQESSKNKIYRYYACCVKNQEKRSCTAHRISKSKLVEEITRQLRFHIDAVIKMDKMMPALDMFLINEAILRESSQTLSNLANEFEQNQQYLKGLYEETATQTLSQDDLDFMRSHYRQKCDEIEGQIQAAEKSMRANLSIEALFGWIEQYRPFFQFQEVTRPMLAYLARRITVDGNKEVRVEFLYESEYRFIHKLVGL